MEKPNRIAEWRDKRELTLEQLAERAGLSVSYLSRMESGKRNVSLKNLAKISEALGVPERELVPDWTDEDDEPSTLITVEGLVGAGGEIEPNYRDGDGENVRQIEVSLNLKPGLVAFEVYGDSMLPKYDPGDFVIVREDHTPPERVIGDVALVVTRDGRRFIKRIQPGSHEGVYNLESFNARTMVDVEVEKFGMIYLVLPAKQAHKPVKDKEVHRRARKKQQAAE